MPFYNALQNIWSILLWPHLQWCALVEITQYVVQDATGHTDTKFMVLIIGTQWENG